MLYKLINIRPYNRKGVMSDAPDLYKYIPSAHEETLLFISKNKPVKLQGAYYPISLGTSYYCVVITDNAIAIHLITPTKADFNRDGNLTLTASTSVLRRPRHMTWASPIQNVPKWLIQLTNRFVLPDPLLEKPSSLKVVHEVALAA